MSIRDKIQLEATQAIIDNKFQGIIDVSPRVGKSKIIIDAFKKLKKDIPILITYPTNNIGDSWNSEFDKWNYDSKNITLINQRSLHKIKKINDYKLIIVDECHSLSSNQLRILSRFKGQSLGLSGSISDETKMVLEDVLGLTTIYEYSVADAVEDEVISDYKIKIITLPLDTKKKYVPGGSKTKPFNTTEEANYKYLTRQFIQASAVAKKDRSKEGWVKSILGKRARAIYGYQSKIDLCKKLLATIPEDEKVLVFTGLTANDICVHRHDSKTEEDNLTLFKDGDITRVQVVDQVSMGQTIPNLKTIIFHQLKSNSEIMLQKALRACNYEDGNIATLYIFCYDNTQDIKWVNKAISMLDQSKIEYLHYKSI